MHFIEEHGVTLSKSKGFFRSFTMFNKGQLWHSVLHLSKINMIQMENLSLFPKINQAWKQHRIQLFGVLKT